MALKTKRILENAQREREEKEKEGIQGRGCRKKQKLRVRKPKK